MRIGAFGCPIGKLTLLMNFLNFTPINPISKVRNEQFFKSISKKSVSINYIFYQSQTQHPQV
jgi:hypothetical protein